MKMQTIKIASNEVITAPPTDQPALPGQQAKTVINPPDSGGKQANTGIPGAIPENDVFKAVEGSKISTLSPMQTDPLAGSPMGSSVPVGGLIDGKLAVELMDALLPSLLVALMAAIGAQMKKTDLQLTAREKSTLEPLMQKCMDQLMINFQNPFAALGVSMLVIYGAKVTEHGVIQIIDKKAAKAAADREQKQKTETVIKTAAPVINSQQQPAGVATVVQMQMPQQPEKKIIKPMSTNWQPSDEQFFEATKRMKGSRIEIIKRLQREHAAGTLDNFFKKKPYSKNR
jgi:hypothetical protein